MAQQELGSHSGTGLVGQLAFRGPLSRNSSLGPGSASFFCRTIMHSCAAYISWWRTNRPCTSSGRAVSFAGGANSSTLLCGWQPLSAPPADRRSVFDSWWEHWAGTPAPVLPA